MGMDDFLRALGLCRRAGRLALGDEPAGTACRAHKCRLLLLAGDAAGNTVRRAEHLAEAGRCPLVRLPWGKETLGAAVGRASCALLAVTDPGLAARPPRPLRKRRSGWPGGGRANRKNPAPPVDIGVPLGAIPSFFDFLSEVA